MPEHQSVVQSTMFIGRTQELSHIATLLADPACRLLNLVGPGGIGKTRLALQAAADQDANFPHGVHVVPLQGVNSTELLPSAIASALKITFLSAENSRLHIINYLRDKHLLLVMDNFEHLLAGVDLLTEILASATSVKILATSRERLNVQEEWTLTLQGLPFPDDQTTEAINSYSAVQLFILRARQAQAEFSFTPNADAVRQICQQVEGMPLGIELAATWLRAMTCQQITEQMGRSLDFLTSPLRNIPERHRSLRTVFEQSWQLLSEKEQDAMMRLSVFRGGFDREAADAVAGATLTALAGLVDKSLIRVNPTGRWDMHELLRQYAADKLGEAGETIATTQRHLEYFVNLAENGEAHAYGREQVVWYDRQEAEMDNLRAALAWALSNEEADKGLRIVGALRWVWEMRGHLNEGLTWYEKLLPVGRFATPSIHAKALHRASDLARQLSYEPQGTIWGQQALQLARDINDRWNIAWSLSAIAYFTGSYQYFDQAVPMLEESLQIFRELKDSFGLSHARRRRAALAIEQYDYAYAQDLLEQALIDDRRAGDRNATAWGLCLLGLSLWCEQHHPDQVITLYQESVSLFQEIRDVHGEGYALALLADVERSHGNYARSRACFEETLRLGRGRGVFHNLDVFVMAGMGSLAAALGKHHQAATLLGAVNAALKSSTYDSKFRPLVEILDRDVDAVRARLGEAAFIAAWAEGQEMTWEQVIAYALQDEAMPQQAIHPLQINAQTLTEPLTPREFDVLRLMADGLSNPQIAAQLIVATGTIKAHTNSIFGKLGVSNRVQAVNRAKELRLLENKLLE
ncbi:MAG: hypothetical protein KF716_19170 [Anaerolineae bacterium]|nr:hypothetical protein [Anaerolineae bacterium]